MNDLFFEYFITPFDPEPATLFWPIHTIWKLMKIIIAVLEIHRKTYQPNMDQIWFAPFGGLNNPIQFIPSPEQLGHLFTIHNWLVVEPNPLKNMTSSVGMMTFPIYGTIKNVPNHQPDNVCVVTIPSSIAHPISNTPIGEWSKYVEITLPPCFDS